MLADVLIDNGLKAHRLVISESWGDERLPLVDDGLPGYIEERVGRYTEGFLERTRVFPKERW